MDRRTALKTMFAGFAGALAATADSTLRVRFRPALAQTNQKTMVFVFQRGGCDGLSVSVPYGDPNYAGLRPNIGIPAPDATNDAASLDLDGYFGLHPALSGMKQIFDEGKLAVLPTTHYNDASQSHFDSSFIIESGGHDILDGGFLNRYLQSVPGDATFRAVSMGGNVDDSLRGQVVVPAVDSLDAFGFSDVTSSGCEEYNLAEQLQAITQVQAANKDNSILVYNQTNKMFEDLKVFEQFEEDYQPGNGAVYPESSYGRHLQTVAQLIKEDVGLEVASVSIGGWDTHANQGNSENPNGSLYRALSQFSDGIRALYQDLGPNMGDVVIVTGTEFGRTALENGSAGTDHGYASTWFAAGGHVNGGIYGEWPTLAEDRMNRGRYLDYNIDYRDIVGNVIRDHLGLENLSSVFPAHTYSPLGLLA